jgi:hypothetical protein
MLSGAVAVVVALAVAVVALTSIHGGSQGGAVHQRSTPGALPRSTPQITPAQARARVSVHAVVAKRICYRPTRVQPSVQRACDHQIPRGFRVGASQQRTVLVSLRFTAPLTADDEHSVYEYSFGRASGPHCPLGRGYVSGTSVVRIDAGHQVLLQDQQSPCPGTYHGLITYQPHGHSGEDRLSWDRPIRDGSRLVGRFKFVIH